MTSQKGVSVHQFAKAFDNFPLIEGAPPPEVTASNDRAPRLHNRDIFYFKYRP